VTSIEDRLALRALAEDYAVAVDDRDLARFTGVFAPDGVLAIFEPGDAEPARVYRGQEELRTVFDLVTTFSATFHLVGNHTCRTDGDRAEGITYCLAHHLTEPSGGEPEDTMMVLRYRDRYVRADDGWRFERRDVLRQWTERHAAERARLFGDVRG